MMSFDSANFIRTGDRTIVRDLSGQGRHGQAVRVSFAEKGKFGNALAMGPGGVEVAKALLDQHPEYTLSCWLYYVPQPMGGVFYSEFLSQDWDRGDTCMFSVREDRGVGIAVWNVANPVRWKLDHTPPGVVPERQWCFVAITLRNGGVDQGEVTVQVDDQRFVLASQQIRSNPPNFPARTSVVGANSALDRGFPGLLDHLWIFTRALSQEEIDLLRETGRPARREQRGGVLEHHWERPQCPRGHQASGFPPFLPGLRATADDFDVLEARRGRRPGDEVRLPSGALDGGDSGDRERRRQGKGRKPGSGAEIGDAAGRSHLPKLQRNERVGEVDVDRLSRPPDCRRRMLVVRQAAK